MLLIQRYDYALSYGASLAYVSFNFGDTRLALDRAAPLKLTLALLLFDALAHIVATTAAHYAARVGRRGRAGPPLALATARTRTIVRRVVHEDEVLFGGLRLVALVARSKARSAWLVAHLDGGVMFGLEVVADFAERRQAQPAGLHAA